MHGPLVSVVIPVYNGADYLRDAVDSVLCQTYSDIEIIVVNDGSSDHGQTEEIARSYGDKIRYIRKKNGGVAAALNVGIEQMKGAYFSWLSHDDIFYPEKIERQMQILKKSDAGITACAYDIFYDSGRKIPVPFADFYDHGMIRNAVFYVLHALIQFGGILLKKEIFEKYGNFREDLKTTQDYEFLFRILRKETCICCSERLYGIRYHANQGSNTISCVNAERDEMYQMFIKALTRSEKELLYGNAYNFYYQMLLRVWPIAEMDRSAELCKEGLRRESDTGREHFLPETGQRPVLIYGAGMYGRRLLFDLRCRGIPVAGFLDSSQQLRGCRIDHADCYSLQDIKDGTVDGTVIIASLFREEIAAGLKEHGILSFYFKEEYEQRFLQTAPDWERIKEVMDAYDAGTKEDQKQ